MEGKPETAFILCIPFPQALELLLRKTEFLQELGDES